MAIANYFDQAKDGEVNTLNLTQGDWNIDGVPVTASAEQLNNGGALQGSINVTLEGAFSVPQPAVLNYTKIGNVVTATIDSLGTVTTDVLSTMTIEGIPSFLRSNFQEAVAYVDNQTSENHELAVRLVIRADGEIVVNSGLADGSFANPTTLAFRPISFTYIANS